MNMRPTFPALLWLLCIQAAMTYSAMPVLAESDAPAPQEQGAEEANLESNEYYTAYNIWFENPTRISSINYKRGSRLPAGSVVSNVRVSGNTIRFYVKEYGTDFAVQFIPKFHPGLTAAKYKDRMFTKLPLAQRTEGMTDVETSGIDAGEIFSGMSKEAVLISWGYPPEHRTLNTQMPRWIYWTSRFVQKTLVFDSDGKLTDFREW